MVVMLVELPVVPALVATVMVVDDGIALVLGATVGAIHRISVKHIHLKLVEKLLSKSM